MTTDNLEQSDEFMRASVGRPTGTAPALGTDRSIRNDAMADSTMARVIAEFAPHDVPDVVLALARYRRATPPDPYGIADSDELIAAIVTLAQGDLRRLRRTIQYARTGPRDILLAAFARS